MLFFSLYTVFSIIKSMYPVLEIIYFVDSIPARARTLSLPEEILPIQEFRPDTASFVSIG